MQLENPAVVQQDDDKNKSRIPLMLIHDGGGTVFQYFLLGEFHRDVYGISNPYFDDEAKKFDGGVPQMAQTYADIIRQTLSSGPLIIGGWSFGGLLSIQVAHILQNDENLRVAGLILLDSSCPWNPVALAESMRRTSVPFRESTSAQIREKTTRCFIDAKAKIRNWSPPTDFISPPAVLIYAEEGSHAEDQDESGQRLSNGDGNLGWSSFPSLSIVSVEKTAGDHFSMFKIENTAKLTDKIRRACFFLEERGVETG